MKGIPAIVICFLVLAGSTTHAELGRRVQIINRSSSPIEYLHAANTDHPKWDEDLLGPMRVIPPGRYIEANIDDGSGHCRYDLRAVLMDGSEAVQPNFDVCANISWTVKTGD
jgi:hypothetical protein